MRAACYRTALLRRRHGVDVEQPRVSSARRECDPRTNGVRARLCSAASTYATAKTQARRPREVDGLAASRRVRIPSAAFGCERSEPGALPNRTRKVLTFFDRLRAPRGCAEMTSDPPCEGRVRARSRRRSSVRLSVSQKCLSGCPPPSSSRVPGGHSHGDTDSGRIGPKTEPSLGKALGIVL